MSTRPQLIDAGVAARVARAVAGPNPPVAPPDRAALRRDFHEFTRTADALVREATGLEPEGDAGTPGVIDRAGWVRVNLDTFAYLLEPLAERLGRTHGATRRVARILLGAQTGLVLGYLARKVLGQYDLFLAPGGRGKVYYVAPNVAEIERREGLTPRDFRFWIALHEVTHRTQFAAVPWLRGHVTGLIHTYFQTAELDTERVKAAARDVVALLRKGPDALRSADILSIVLTPEQHAVMQRMQALMCVVEGHGNFVMDRVGAERIPTYHRMKQAMMRRRERGGPGQKAFESVMGIEMKLQQYALGERFVKTVDERAGRPGVNRVWEREENLPTMDEIREPDRWLARTQPDAAGATPGL